MESKLGKVEVQKNNTANRQEKADQVEIVYYTDPLCCWSWAFEPQWRKLRYVYRDMISWRYCMGGLLPGWKNFYDPVNSVSRPAQMGPVWMEAGHMSGMPINTSIWMKDPPASSYLACIAVKCAGLQSRKAEEEYLRCLREAVMVKGRNISFASTLTELARELNQKKELIDIDQFIDDLAGERGRETFRSDIQETQINHIARFPTIIMRRTGYKSILLSGYRPYISLKEAFMQMAPDAHGEAVIDANDYQNYWQSLTKRELEEI